MMRASPTDVTMMFALLARPGDVFELRGLARVDGRQLVHSGYFDDVEQLAKAAAQRSGNDDGVYVTINPVNPALLARASKNRVRRAGNGDTTSDRDVATRRALLVDVDPIRPTGISSTDAEHDSAIALVRTIAAELGALGWPEPIVADSGNGGHLVYGIDLPVDDGGLVKRVLEQLSKRFTTSALKVDEKVFNPARISKIYGTLTRKGADTPERPHRLARILSAPRELVLVPVSREQLEAFAPIATPAKKPDRQPTNGNGTHHRTFDLDAWIAEHLPDATEQPWTEGRKWLLPVCPFNDSHDRKEAHLEQFPSGAVSAGCLHESCKWTWRELRQKFEPDAYDRAPRDQNGHRLTDREPPPEYSRGEVVYEDRPARAVGTQNGSHNNADREPLSAEEVFAARDSEPDEDAARVAREQEDRNRDELQGMLVGEVAKLETPPIRSYATGNMVLNNLLGGGINTRELLVVMGPPGACKTAWAISTAIELERQVPVLYGSTELEQHELMARIASHRIGKSWAGIRRGVIDRDLVIGACDDRRIYLLGSDSMPRDGTAAIALIAKRAELIASRHGTSPLVIVDYLQDLARGAERDVRGQIGDHATELRRLAQRLDCAVIAVSSVARKFYSPAIARKLREADDPAEYLIAAKESGDVDYAAARVLFLDGDDDRDRAERAVRIAVAKSRDARTGFAGARVISECGRFIEAPEVVREMAAVGRATEATSDVESEHDAAIFARVDREHRDGKAALCTERYLRTGNRLRGKPLGVESTRAAIDRLQLAKRLEVHAVDRQDTRGRNRTDRILGPVGCACAVCQASRPAAPIPPAHEQEVLL